MTNHEVEELKLVASAEFVARTAGMQFPIEVIAVSANRYFPFLSRICGLIVVPEGARVCDTARFP